MLNDETDSKGVFDYLESHALISDQTLDQIHRFCDFSASSDLNSECDTAVGVCSEEVSDIDRYNIYAPLCTDDQLTARPKKISVT